MPRGRVSWFDPVSGDGVIVAGGHEYATHASDVVSGQLAVRVPVHFDVLRDGRIDRAARVRVRSGRRVGRRQHRFGETTARSPDAAGAARLSRRRPRLGRRSVGRPKQLVGEWLETLANGDFSTAALFFAPDAVRVIDGREVSGRALIERELPALVPSRLARIRIRGAGPNEIVTTWTDGRETTTVVSGVEHGLIHRQAMTRRGPEIG